MSGDRRSCRCCSGTGTVEAHTGDMRPCSRCRVDAFHAWYIALVSVTVAKHEVEGRR